MYLKINNDSKKLEIWISNENKQECKNDEYKQIVDEYKNLGFSICTFIGGEAPLLPSIASLLKEQSHIA